MLLLGFSNSEDKVVSRKKFVSAVYSGDYATVFIVYSSKKSLVHMLCTYEGYDSCTPLMIAAHESHDKVVALLVEYGANVTEKHFKNNVVSVMDFALESKKKDFGSVALFLLLNGARCSDFNYYRKTIRRKSISLQGL